MRPKASNTRHDLTACMKHQVDWRSQSKNGGSSLLLYYKYFSEDFVRGNTKKITVCYKVQA